jgi:acetyl-CoA/propionyl-CoA carboxylase biotin carboxyl carrier protein
VRVDSGYVSGDEVPAAYDSLIAKLIVRARDREEARRRMLRALDELAIEGIATTIPAHRLLLASQEFRSGEYTTRTVEGSNILAPLAAGADGADVEENVLLVGGRAIKLWSPAMASSAAAAVHGSPGAGEVVAPMQGTILEVLVRAGDEVRTGDPVVVLEAMKMETTIAAPRTGTVTELRVEVGDGAASGQVLAVVG